MQIRTALVQCPAWGRQNPPLALSMLSAYLRNKGKQVYLFDLNNELFHAVNDENKRLWRLNNEAFWEDKNKVLKFAEQHDELFNYFVEKILNIGATIIGFSIFNSSKHLSLLVAEKIKRIDKDKVIVFGGPNCAPHMQGAEIINNPAVDIIAISEGELTLEEVIDIQKRCGKIDFCKGVWLKKDGKIIDCGIRPLIEDLNILPFADFDDFTLSSYDEPNRLPVYFSRGCINRCVYCNENLFWNRYRARRGKRVFEDIKFQINKHKEVTHFDFTDSLVNGDINQLSNFADLIIAEGLKITWGAQATIRPQMTAELLKKLKKSGCICLAYGIESGSQKILDLMKKNFKIKDAQRVLQDTYEAGIYATANFMFGFPGETEEDFNCTLDFLHNNKAFISTLNPSLACTAIGVGTYLYEHAEEYGVDLNKGHLFWSSYDGGNTYEKRKARYLTFCKLASSLGIKLSYTIDLATQ